MTEPMTNADNFWLCMDRPTNLMLITAFMEFEKNVNYERLQATIESRLSSFPRFRQRVVRPVSGIGLPSWETDGHFDVRFHIGHRIGCAIVVKQFDDITTLNTKFGRVLRINFQW